MNRCVRIALFPALLLGSVVAATSQTESTLYSFTGRADGGMPSACLTVDVAGNLYTTTTAGGAHGFGAVIELSPTTGGGWVETVLYSFAGGSDGATPDLADLIFDKAGNLYGTTFGGGTHNLGTVFELTPTGSGWVETVLYSFAGGVDGSNPYAGLCIDPWGNLYGTTRNGGSYDLGTVFQLQRRAGGKWTENVLHTFDGISGSDPVGGLVYDHEGNLFGTTYGGGNYGAGEVFELKFSGNDSWTTQVIYSFTNGPDGGFPFAERLIFDRVGNLYGTTQGGGMSAGVVFRLSPGNSGWTEQVLYQFNWAVEIGPPAGLVMDGKGSLYGVCENGNRTTTFGSVFKLTLNSDGTYTESDLHMFTGPDGEFPEAGLLLDKSGHLYGTTPLGGASNTGVVYELSK